VTNIRTNAVPRDRGVGADRLGGSRIQIDSGGVRSSRRAGSRRDITPEDRRPGGRVRNGSARRHRVCDGSKGYDGGRRCLSAKRSRAQRC
jgi:hypothetical protein